MLLLKLSISITLFVLFVLSTKKYFTKWALEESKRLKEWQYISIALGAALLISLFTLLHDSNFLANYILPLFVRDFILWIPGLTILAMYYYFFHKKNNRH